jgi:hypothetical protein
MAGVIPAHVGISFVAVAIARHSRESRKPVPLVFASNRKNQKGQNKSQDTGFALSRE